MILNRIGFQEANYINEEQHRKLQETCVILAYQHLCKTLSISIHDNLSYHLLTCTYAYTYFPGRVDFLKRTNSLELDVSVKCLTVTYTVDKSGGSTNIFHRKYLSVGHIYRNARTSNLYFTYFVYDHWKFY